MVKCILYQQLACSKCTDWFGCNDRLLRNRVSAQQARERKKSYVQDLEQKCLQSDQKTVQMEQRIKILERENVMLRQVIKNMQGSNSDGNSQ